MRFRTEDDERGAAEMRAALRESLGGHSVCSTQIVSSLHAVRSFCLDLVDVLSDEQVARLYAARQARRGR